MVHWFEEPFALVPTPLAKLPEGEKPDVFNDVATEMALAHNVIIRGLNSVYVQAPYVKPEDEHAFLLYARNLFHMLAVHHDSEEDNFFPAVERMAGEPGIMATNVAQHQAFHDGIEALMAYVKKVLDGGEPYDGRRVVKLIDAFGSTLVGHLTEEIQTLLDLKRYGAEKMKGLPKALFDDGQANFKKIGLVEGAVAAFLGHDSTWENGIWATNFPPVPWVVKGVVLRGVFYLRSSWWRFAPCDQNLMPKPRPYAGP